MRGHRIGCWGTVLQTLLIGKKSCSSGSHRLSPFPVLFGPYTAGKHNVTSHSVQPGHCDKSLCPHARGLGTPTSDGKLPEIDGKGRNQMARGWQGKQIRAREEVCWQLQCMLISYPLSQPPSPNLFPQQYAWHRSR